MFGLGPMELIIVFLVILLIFGAKRIPEIAQGLGKGITEFKKAARDVTDEIDTSTNAATQAPQVKSKVNNQTNNQAVQNELKSQQADTTQQQSQQS